MRRAGGDVSPETDGSAHYVGIVGASHRSGTNSTICTSVPAQPQSGRNSNSGCSGMFIRISVQVWDSLARHLTRGWTDYSALISGAIWVSSWRAHCTLSSRLRRRSMWDTTRPESVRVFSVSGFSRALPGWVARTFFKKEAYCITHVGRICTLFTRTRIVSPHMLNLYAQST